MDWITHYMVAFSAGRKLRLSRLQMMAITLGALILDVDIVLYLLPGGLSHGTLTHTLGGALALGAICTLALFLWKRKWVGRWVALGIASHLALDMINTLSVYDGGKMLLYPFADTVFSLKDWVPHPDIAWYVLTALIFSFSIIMLAANILRGIPPWRVWFDERPLVRYWREKFSRTP